MNKLKLSVVFCFAMIAILSFMLVSLPLSGLQAGAVLLLIWGFVSWPVALMLGGMVAVGEGEDNE